MRLDDEQESSNFEVQRGGGGGLGFGGGGGGMLGFLLPMVASRFGCGGVVVLLIALALALSTMLVFWLRGADNRLFAGAIGLVLGGAVGNAIDRVNHGAVIDFLDFHLAGYHWPAFNLADSAIVIGVAAIILEGLITRSKDKKG